MSGQKQRRVCRGDRQTSASAPTLCLTTNKSSDPCQDPNKEAKLTRVGMSGFLPAL